MPDRVPASSEPRKCRVCGAALNADESHRHEAALWRPTYDDFEGVLEGYETVPATAKEKS